MVSLVKKPLSSVFSGFLLEFRKLLNKLRGRTRRWHLAASRRGRRVVVILVGWNHGGDLQAQATARILRHLHGVLLACIFIKHVVGNDAAFVKILVVAGLSGTNLLRTSTVTPRNSSTKKLWRTLPNLSFLKKFLLQPFKEREEILTSSRNNSLTRSVKPNLEDPDSRKSLIGSLLNYPIKSLS